MDLLNLETEVVLAPSIQFDKSFREFWLQPKSILLTGATGFLGAYLLNELLEKTQAKIYCLVRCSDSETGKDRIKASLTGYLLWKEEFSSRIIPVKGDLSKPLFGLSQKEFWELGALIDSIYHNGAWVNSFYPYSTLKATNVLGTQEVIRLASYSKTKPVHFISTIGVFYSPSHSSGNLIKETDNPQSESLKGGYKQSKWVGEQLIIMAKKRGLPASIYRIGRIMGHSQTGIIGNQKDLLCLVIKACISIGKFPAVETEVDIVPVDYVSKAIVSLSQQKKTLETIFHILNPQPMAWKNLINEIKSLEYDLEEVSYENWLKALKNYAKIKNDKELYSIARLFLSSPIKLFSEKPNFEVSHTQECLTGTSIVCPPIDKKLLSAYLSYFQKSGYLPVVSGF